MRWKSPFFIVAVLVVSSLIFSIAGCRRPPAAETPAKENVAVYAHPPHSRILIPASVFPTTRRLSLISTRLLFGIPLQHILNSCGRD